MSKKQTNTKIHLPVMAQEVLEYLHPKRGESYLDVTAGYGGHAEAVLEVTLAPKKAVLVDRDQNAADYLSQKFSGCQIIRQDFLGVSKMLLQQGRQFDMILADLGLSSAHLDEAERGFSIAKRGPLDMRMDQSQNLDALEIVNHWSEEDLAKILKELGEEPKARQIAGRIIAKRPFETTDQLAAIVAKAWKGKSKIHPATRTFQAIRMAVNDELNQLKLSLPLWAKLLAPGGRLVIISFHSLEDRLVKQFFADSATDTYDAELVMLNKKPIRPSHDEIVSNPRARSAKLRASSKK